VRAERDWTVLLIGGSVGAGKSTLARGLATYFGINAIEGDLLRLVLLSAVSANAEPDLHLFSEPGVWSRPVEELVARSLSADRYLCRIAEPVLVRQIVRNEPSVLEAVWLRPEFATQGVYAGRHVTKEVAALFLYEPELDVLRNRFEGRGEWWAGVAVDERERRIAYFYAFGLEVKRRAESLRLPVLESRPFETLFERALAALDSS
jgi:2-phosphoglycerate kinase